jgi:hypothetical protein
MLSAGWQFVWIMLETIQGALKNAFVSHPLAVTVPLVQFFWEK